MRKLVRGYPGYVIDTDWLVRMPGKLFIRLCKGLLLAGGTFLDRQMKHVFRAFVAHLKKPDMEMHLTSGTLGVGVWLAILLFSLLLASYFFSGNL